VKTVVELNDIRKIYQMGTNEVHALRGLDLSIADGEFVAIMGASGSGKSTLLNVLGCLDKPTSGLYLLDGQRVDRMDDEQLAAVRRTRLGFVFQSFNLLYRSTALENVELPMVYLGIPRRERIRRARAALETVGLADRMDHMPTQLSGGQQQRVALARALVARPKLLLADEPTGNLDSRTSEEVLELLTRLQRDERLTMIMVTHDPDIAAFAHRVVILYDGRVIYNKPSPHCGGPEIPHVKTVGLGSHGPLEQVPAKETA
jgi:putative ABC transport system ATP-binding protein